MSGDGQRSAMPATPNDFARPILVVSSGDGRASKGFRCTLGDLINDDDGIAEERDTIRAALTDRGTWVGEGGAAPAITIRALGWGGLGRNAKALTPEQYAALVECGVTPMRILTPQGDLS